MATIEVKVIKPKKLDEAAMLAAFKPMLADVEKGILKDFEDTTETWQHKPKWNHDHALTAQAGVAFVDTQDEIYTYVNEGTKPHPVPKRGTTFMRFQWGGKGSYRPKTKPGRFGSRPGGPSGPVVVAFKVQHPGTDPRKFDELLKKRWATLFPRAIDAAMKDAAHASGHAIA